MTTPNNFEAELADAPGAACTGVIKTLSDISRDATYGIPPDDPRLAEIDSLVTRLCECKNALEGLLGRHGNFMAGLHSDTVRVEEDSGDYVYAEAESYHRALLNWSSTILGWEWTTDTFRFVCESAWDSERKEADWDAPQVKGVARERVKGWCGLNRFVNWERLTACVRKETAAIEEQQGVRAHLGPLKLKAIHLALINAAETSPLSMDELSERAGYSGGHARAAIKALADAGAFSRHDGGGFSLNL